MAEEHKVEGLTIEELAGQAAGLLPDRLEMHRRRRRRRRRFVVGDGGGDQIVIVDDAPFFNNGFDNDIEFPA